MSVLTVITVVAVLPEIVDITTTLTSTFIALFYRMVIFDIKIIMVIIVVMTVIFVMVVYCIHHNGCYITVYCFIGYNCTAWSRSQVRNQSFGPKQNTKLTVDHPQPTTTTYRKLFEGF